MSVNKVILVGRLGQNPEVRYTPSGQAVANFSIATNDNWTDKQGQKQERVEWHRIVVWGKTAELCQQYLSKGRQAYIEGRLQTRQWQDKDGQTKYTTEVQAQTVQFLGGNDRSAGGANAGMDQGMESQSHQGAGGYGYQQQGGQQSHSGGGYNANNNAGGAPAARPGMPEPSFTEDDVPF